jgi:ribosomal protein S18 acetylase RimI-like enzyme
VTTSIGRLFFEMGTRRLPALLPPLLNRFVQQPALIGRSLQTAIYPFVTGRSVAKNDDKDENTAELLAIMADPAWRRQGLGSSLLEQIVDVCHSRAIAHLDVTVDAANTAARHFYEHHGFVFRRQVRLYGRPMVLYRMRVQP